jgi:type IV pilus assembly protein PilV
MRGRGGQAARAAWTAGVAGAATTARRPRQAAGFTLVEVLVAVLVLSLGVLGAAGMQAASLRSNREARAQEVGTRLATELAELMRANHMLASQKSAAANPYLLDFANQAPAAGANCFTASSCNTALAIAQRDVADWAQRAAQVLPGIRVKVCFDAAPTAGGLPEWACDGNGDTLYVKIGWTRMAADSRRTTLDAATVPAVMLPVSPVKV